MNTPLAERLRPRNIDEFIGQKHLLGEGMPVRLQIESGLISSMIFWGPPGTGKTTLARIIAEETGRPFFPLSAIQSGVKDVREVIQKARNGGGVFTPGGPILFIDEIHRFSKSQQDSLLAAVEEGWVTLIGATTENPSFEVVPALRSRCQIYVLESFGKEELELLLERALEKDSLLKTREVEIREKNGLLRYSGGDGRKLLNILELVVQASEEGAPAVVDDRRVETLLQEVPVAYDKNGEQHYDIISAFIKSIRGSDPNASVYWLARMLGGGEDVAFIARRLLILAAEDIGNANPNALLLAQSTFEAVRSLGMPEARIPLSQCAIYLACSPKSNSSYRAIDEAMRLVRETGDLPVPLHLRNAPTQLMKDLGYGERYQYAHDAPGHFVRDNYLPEDLRGRNILRLSEQGVEARLKKDMQVKWDGHYDFEQDGNSNERATQ